MPDPSPKLMSIRMQTAFPKSSCFAKASADGKQQAGVAELPQQSSYTPKHRGVVIDDKNKVPIWHADSPTALPSAV
jgi:hypothetical protein